MVEAGEPERAGPISARPCPSRRRRLSGAHAIACPPSARYGATEEPHMSRYGDFVRAHKEPEPVYEDREVKDILVRVVKCFISHIGCPDGHWCFVDRDPGGARPDRETTEPCIYKEEGHGDDTICVRVKTGAAQVEGERFGVFDLQICATPYEDGEVVLGTSTGSVEFCVWRGEVRFGPALDALFADLMYRLFEERYDAEDDNAEGEGDRVSAVTPI